LILHIACFAWWRRKPSNAVKVSIASLPSTPLSAPDPTLQPCFLPIGHRATSHLPTAVRPPPRWCTERMRSSLRRRLIPRIRCPPLLRPHHPPPAPACFLDATTPAPHTGCYQWHCSWWRTRS
jgi:hypothetical protein